MRFLWAGLTGLEPATYCVTGNRSNQLSYSPIFYCSRSGTRTHDPSLMKAVL